MTANRVFVPPGSSSRGRPLENPVVARRWIALAIVASLAAGATAIAIRRNARTEPLSEPAGRLVTNEFAYEQPNDAQAVRSSEWVVTSGSLFMSGSVYSTGHPDDRDPGPTSQPSTNSAVFRVVTQRTDYLNVSVSFLLENLGLTRTRKTPAVATDGVHVFVRYQNPFHLYAVSVNRRDGSVVIKKKCPGGSTNGGTYFDLGPSVSHHSIPFGATQHVGAAAVTNPDGTVTLRLYREGRMLLENTDRGIGCAPITAPGRVGIRGDNDEFQFSQFVVDPA